MERGRGGRPSKGDRKHLSTKLPRPLLEAAQEYAARHGMTVTDLVGELLADKVGVDYSPQGGLDLTA